MNLSAVSSAGVKRIANVRRIFKENESELQELAFLLTGDESIAEACVVEACRTAESLEHDYREICSMRSARYRTICVAADLRQRRILQLACLYHSRQRRDPMQTSLTAELLEILLLDRPMQLLKMDMLCRFALILCGVERESFGKAALLLGVSRNSIQTAYDAAVGQLEAIRCARMIESSQCSMLWN